MRLAVAQSAAARALSATAGGCRVRSRHGGGARRGARGSLAVTVSVSPTRPRRGDLRGRGETHELRNLLRGAGPLDFGDRRSNDDLQRGQSSRRRRAEMEDSGNAARGRPGAKTEARSDGDRCCPAPRGRPGRARRPSDGDGQPPRARSTSSQRAPVAEAARPGTRRALVRELGGCRARARLRDPEVVRTDDRP